MLLRAAVCLGGLLAAGLPQAEAVGVATASIDLGNEWLKIGLVKPGVPMDIVLNQESKRKTRVVIGLRDNERTFEGPAVVVSTKYPKYAFAYLTELLGVQADSQVVSDYKKRFPYHTIEAHPVRGTVVFRLGEATYTVEELMAQILDHAVEQAAQFAEQEIVGIVVTVPPYFNQAQRKAVLLVGRIANIKILQLLNSNTAVGINYGVFRAKTFNKTATNIIFYDMGATSTIATVVSYTTVKEKSQTTKGRTPQLEIAGVGYDRTLGGNAWDTVLQQHLLSEFMKNKKVKGRDVSKDARAMAKLWASSEKVKRVLSANKETKAQVEGLYDEIDFKTKVTREELYTMTEDLFARVAQPIQDALQDANLTTADIDQLIIFGGGVRIPRVQDILLETIGAEQLGKSINGDEAACLGASYRAAVLSKAFRVSKFLVKDVNLYPIQMHYNKTKDGSVKKYTEKIFPRNHPTTKPKILLFNRSNDDFHFELNYGDLSFLTDAELASFGPTSLSAHNLTNLSATVTGHEDDVRKGVRVKFGIDDSGIVHLTGGEVVFEREPAPEPVEKSTLESLSDYFFGSSDDDNATAANATNTTVNSNSTVGANATEADTKAEEEAPKKEEKTEEKKEEKSKEKKEEKLKEKKEEKSKEEEEKTEEKEEVKKENTTTVNASSAESASNGTVEDVDGNATAANETDAKKPKMIKIVEKVSSASEYRDIPDASDEFLEEVQGRIKELVDLETERVARAAAYNTLESGIYTARDQLFNPAFEAVSTEEQRENMTTNITVIGEWLDEDGWQANTTELNARIRTLESTMKSVRFRVQEAEERPKAIAQLRDGLNNTKIFHTRLVNYSNNLPENATEWHTKQELDELNSLYNDTLVWLDEKEAAQNETAPHESPVLFSRHVISKLDKLYREVSYLNKRPKPKPKKKKVPKVKVNDSKIVIDGEELTLDLNSTNATNATDDNATNTTADNSTDAAEELPEATAAKDSEQDKEAAEPKAEEEGVESSADEGDGEEKDEL